jgi:hypothetical protein
MLSGAILMGGCWRPPLLRVTLKYRPTNTLEFANIAGALPVGQSLAVTVTDSRSDRSTVGKNIENNVPVPVYAEHGTPDQFVREAISRELTHAGFLIVTEPTQATRILQLDLRQFWTEESSMYRGMITVNVGLKTALGKVLWQGGGGGSSNRFGRSLKPENYQEAFSDAVVDLVQNLLKNQDFMNALRSPDAPSQE